MKNDIISKIDVTAELLNSKIEKNKEDISSLKDEVTSHNDKLENITTQSKANTEEISDLKLRIDKLEREKELNNQ